MVDPKVQQRNMSDYLKLTSFLAPQDATLNKPTIRHPDLSPTNIFISDSGDITGIIDWQHSTVLPIFLQAKIPKHFQNYGDEDSENFERPRAPDMVDTWSEAEKTAAMELYRRRQVHYFYLGHTSHINPSHFHAMGSPNLVMRNRPYDVAGRPWEGDNTSLKAELIRVVKLWDDMTSQKHKTECPVQYLEVELEEESSRCADTGCTRLYWCQY